MHEAKWSPPKMRIIPDMDSTDRARKPWLLLAALSLMTSAACSVSPQDPKAGTSVDPSMPTIVVTSPVLGSVVSELVSGTANLDVLMPGGADPHDHRPSAREIARIEAADFVVANGMGLEEGFIAPLARAAEHGVVVFYATDHLGEESPEGVSAQHGSDHGSDHDESAHDDSAHDHDDPHFWVDPVAVAHVMDALATELSDELGVDLGSGPASLQRQLMDLDRRTADTLSSIPPDRRVLVTSHLSMGWFARRYDLRIAGALVSSMSSQAAPTAGDIARLKRLIVDEGVPAIFTETGTSSRLADTVARETGVRVIPIATHTLPDDGSYETFISDLASAIAGGLDG